jgi:hypothetical protein
MAHERNPYQPYRSPEDPHLSNLSDDDIRRSARFDNDPQRDSEPTERPAGEAKVAMFAIAVAVVLGAAFYGLNNTSIHQAATSSTAQNTAETSAPAAPPGMRDVTPRRTNTDQGVTTGAAAVRPQTPPATAPAAMNRAGNSPANNATSK